MDSETLDDNRHALLFDIRRSIRYHNRRRQFFDRYRASTSALSLVFGSATIYIVLSSFGEYWVMGSAAAVSVVSAIDLVVGSAKMARLHEDLYRRFVALEKSLISIPSDRFSEQDLCLLTAERLDIEAEEPPIKRVLDSICYNELVRAMGLGGEHAIQVRWYQRYMAQFIDIQAYRTTSLSQAT